MVMCATVPLDVTMGFLKPIPPAGALRGRLRIRSAATAVDAPGSPAALRSLMAASATGDRTAFATLYDQLAPAIHGVTLRVIRDPSMAEEVTQEVFVEMWRIAPRYDATKGSVRSWAMAIAHNRSVDRVRAEQSSRNRDERDALEQPSTAPAADEPVEVEFERQRVRRALELLTDTQRQAVELAYFGGHTYREVALILDVAEGTVKTRIRDGLIRLRTELSDAGAAL